MAILRQEDPYKTQFQESLHFSDFIHKFDKERKVIGIRGIIRHEQKVINEENQKAYHAGSTLMRVKN